MDKWQCMECGKVFRTVRAAERAAMDGCPNCGGVDIDIHVDRSSTPPTLRRPAEAKEPPRCKCGVILESQEIAAGLCDYCDWCKNGCPSPPVPF